MNIIETKIEKINEIHAKVETSDGRTGVLKFYTGAIDDATIEVNHVFGVPDSLKIKSSYSYMEIEFDNDITSCIHYDLEDIYEKNETAYQYKNIEEFLGLSIRRDNNES